MKNHLTFVSRMALAAIATAALSLISVASANEETKTDTSPKKESSSSSLSKKDTTFITHAYRGGMKEIAMGEMGQKDATSDDVKKVAEKIASDHTDANKELKELADKKGVTLPEKAPSMKKYPGDKEYLTMMKTDHEKDIAAFEKEANDSGSNEDADVKAWANKTLPTLKDHLKMVNDALEKMK